RATASRGYEMSEQVVDYEARQRTRRLLLLRHGRKPWRRWFTQYGMIAPMAILFLGITIYPLILAVRMSFLDWDATSIDHPFIGLANYQELLTQDPRFIADMVRTGVMGGSALLIEFI